MAFNNDQFSLANKTAIVTGAGGRGNSIGRAYAFGLGNAGANVLVADLNADGARNVAEELKASGINAVACQVDIADPQSTKEMAKKAKEAFGGVNILVNNAAMMAELSFEQIQTTDIESWNKLFAVNLTGALNCVRPAPVDRHR